MAILKEEDQQLLRDKFAQELQAPVKLVHFTQGVSDLLVPGRPACPTCREARALLEEVAELSDAITLELHDFYVEQEPARTLNIDKIPATVITSDGPSGVRYFGIPAGYEFAVLIEDIVTVSKGSPELSAKTKEELAKLPGEAHIQVFVTPT